MRNRRKVFGPQPAPPPPVVAPSPLPAEDRRRLREAQERIPRKWEALDGLLGQFADTDVVLRVERR